MRAPLCVLFLLTSPLITAFSSRVGERKEAIENEEDEAWDADEEQGWDQGHRHLEVISAKLVNWEVQVSLRHDCGSHGEMDVVEVTVMLEGDDSAGKLWVESFSKFLECAGEEIFEVVAIPIDDHLALGYSSLWTDPHHITYAEVQLTVKDPQDQPLYFVSSAFNFPGAYLRPSAFFSTETFEDFALAYRSRVAFLSATCGKPPERITISDFPAVFYGGEYGLQYSFPEFEEPPLAGIPSEAVFSFTAAVYFSVFCPTGEHCSIFHHSSWDDLHLNVMLLVRSDGVLSVQVADDTQDLWQVTLGSVRLKTWTQLLLTLSYPRVTLTLRDDELGWRRHAANFSIDQESIEYNDCEGTFHFGGSPLFHSYEGLFDNAVWWRGREVPWSTVAPLSTLSTSITEEFTLYDNFVLKVNEHIKLRNELLNAKMTAHNVVSTHPLGFNPLLVFKSTSNVSTCQAYELQLLSIRNELNDARIASIIDDASSSLSHTDDLVRVIWSRIKQLPEDDIEGRKTWLLAAHKVGDGKASYMLSVYTRHIRTKAVASYVERRADILLLCAVLRGDLLATLALANRHHTGVSNLPLQQEYAYLYMKRLADTAQVEMFEHKEEDLLTQRIYLTDETSLQSQTHEEDDSLFMWLNYQSALGVTSARDSLARMFMLGTQGVRRDLGQAAAIFRDLAVNQGDAESLFNYGVALMYGRGVPENHTEALVHLRDAAKQDHGGAYATIGWYYLEVEKNATKALYFIKRASDLGVDSATYNIGYMYYNGYVPGKRRNPKRAFKYFKHAAEMGNVEGCQMVAYCLMRGVPGVERDPYDAVSWARYNAEQISPLAHLFRDGIAAYLSKDYTKAALQHLPLADAGVPEGAFNLAFLCQHGWLDCDSLLRGNISFWYNVSLHRHYDVEPYALVRLGDAALRNNDTLLAIQEYTTAANHHNYPEAYFSLAHLVSSLPRREWAPLLHNHEVDGVPFAGDETTFDLAVHLLSSCSEHGVTIFRTDEGDEDGRDTSAQLACELYTIYLYVDDAYASTHPVVLMMYGFVAVFAVWLSTQDSGWST